MKNSKVTYQFPAGTSQTTTPISLNNWPAWILSLGKPQISNNYTYTGYYGEFGKTFRYCERKGASKFDRMIWGRVINDIYLNPKVTEVDLIARILSVCVNIQKYAKYICDRMQRTLCVNSRITIKSRAASSTALVNYSIILTLKLQQ
jgi:hypothetical protein